MAKKPSQTNAATTPDTPPVAETPETDTLSDLLVSDEPEAADSLSDIGESRDAPAPSDDLSDIGEQAEEDEAARAAATSDESEESDEERMTRRAREEFGHDAIVLRERTVLLFNGAEVALPCSLPVIMLGSHDEPTLAAVLVRNRENFHLNKHLLQHEYNPLTGVRVMPPVEPKTKEE